MIKIGALFAAALLLASPAASRTDLSVEANHAGHSVRGRRLQRHHCPRHRQGIGQRLGPAGDRGEPRRRGRRDRRRDRRERRRRTATRCCWYRRRSRSTRRSRRACRSTPQRISPRSPLSRRSPLLFVSSKGLAVKSAKDALALAKSKPGALTYASAGVGSINQIAAELIAQSAGVKLLHVPYKGGAPALNDLVGGHVDLYVSSMPQVQQLAQSGQVNALAVTSVKRSRVAAGRADARRSPASRVSTCHPGGGSSVRPECRRMSSASSMRRSTRR